MVLVRMRGGVAGTVTLMAGVDGITIFGIVIFMSGKDGITIVRGPVAPGLKMSAFGFFSGVTVTVRVLWSRTTVSVTSPVSFLPSVRVMSPGEETLSPSIAVITSPALNPA